jgi:uncharacterized membrane protein YeaQ/YmgE (transglycosylase-associated protein family)
MILPGLISLAFYKRPPSRNQIILGLVATIALSAVLGYISPGGPIGQWGSVIVAIIGGVLLYVAILAFLNYRYRSKQTAASAPVAPSVPP